MEGWATLLIIGFLLMAIIGASCNFVIVGSIGIAGFLCSLALFVVARFQPR